jgi:hypothetical protein
MTEIPIKVSPRDFVKRVVRESREMIRDRNGDHNEKNETYGMRVRGEGGEVWG